MTTNNAENTEKNMNKLQFEALNLSENTPVIYRRGASPEAAAGIFRYLTPKGGYVILNFDTVVALDQFHVLEVLPVVPPRGLPVPAPEAPAPAPVPQSPDLGEDVAALALALANTNKRVKALEDEVKGWLPPTNPPATATA